MFQNPLLYFKFSVLFVDLILIHDTDNYFNFLSDPSINLKTN